MNLLILSAGTRNKVVQYCKQTVGEQGKVVATDCSNLAPALYDADCFYLVPRIDAPDYMEHILEICQKENIQGVFSLIDPELSLLAKERDRFLAIGVTPIVSPYALVEACLDKYQMFKLLGEMGIPTGKCYLDMASFEQAKERGEIQYPVFVKPVKGSASMNINQVHNDRELKLLLDTYDNLMIQEYMQGKEYGADVYVDMLSKKCTAIFLKEKIRMRAGETDKSISVKKPEWFKKIIEFVEACGFLGMIDIDLFEIDGVMYISEVNPRFGGGYPHAYACGVDFPSMIQRNLAGEENPVSIGDYQEGICMMKYNELVVKAIPQEQII